MRPHDAFIALALFAAVVSLYARTIRFDYVLYDDHDYVFEEPHMQGGLTAESFRWSLTAIKVANWHPLTLLSYLSDVSVFGVSAGAIHRTNFLLHALNTALLFALLKQLTGWTWRSAFVAALFGVHPLHVESVAWISERKDVLSTLFLFLATMAYVRYARTGRKRWYAATTACFVLGFFAKPMIVTLPGMLLLLDYWPLERLRTRAQLGRRVMEKWPLIALSIVFCLVTWWAQKIGGAIQPIDAVPMRQRLANAWVSYAAYLGKMLWPRGLAIPYPMRENLPAWKVAGAIFLIVALTVAAVELARRGRKYVAVGWFWYLGTLVPVIGIVQVGDQAMADRYSYVPLIGPFLIIAWGAIELTRRIGRIGATALAAAAVACLVALCLITWIQIGHWRDTNTLFTHSVTVNANNWLAWHQLGLYYVSRNQLDAADAMYQRALRLRPNSSVVNYNYANNLARQGRLDEAEAHFQRALKTHPDFARALNNYGNLLIRQNRLHDAFDRFSAAVAADPNFAEAHANLGWMLLGAGQIDNAEREFREAVRLKPGLREGERGLAKVAELRGSSD